LVLLIAARRDEFVAARSAAAAWGLAVTVLLQIVALVARSEAWHLTIGAAGGTVDRRVVYRASSMQVLGSVGNGNLGVAARIAALRRSSPPVSPQVPTLIAAEFPILAVEAMLAALASFTLVGPLGLPWWLPLVGLARSIRVVRVDDAAMARGLSEFENVVADIEASVLFLDAVFLSVRPDGPKEGVLVAWGFTEEGEAVMLGMRESHEDWLALGRDLIARGLGAPMLIVEPGWV
jgi:hypothetical protein